jgi:glycosyltransferase involved in cell wall biosynthesis
LTTLARWRGQPAGILRCAQKYSDYAFRSITNARFTLFDPQIRRYRLITRDVAGRIIQGTLKADMMMMPDLNPHARHFVDVLPSWLQPTYWWIAKSRRRVISKLEEVRLGSHSPRIAAIAERFQRNILKPKEKDKYFRADGFRIDHPPFKSIAGAVVEFQPDDITMAIQSDWVHTDINAIAALKAIQGWRHAILCHDLIPIQFPHWYGQPEREGFKTYYDKAFAVADRVMFTSKCTREDATAYCHTLGIPLADSAVVPMGSDIAAKRTDALLPDRLVPGAYCLFVSTIEPRKNHVLLTQAWKRLVSDEIVAKSGFKLVFVGRPGWQMGSFHEDIATDPLLKDSVMHLSDVNDETLARLYEDAGFCLYPPKFEGFGLPIIEALAYGKALLVSNAGPMPEIAGDFAIALDPEDANVWADAIERWILHPEERERLARRTRNDYQPLTWDESAKLFFDRALAPFQT